MRSLAPLLALALAGCAASSAADLRQSRLSGHLAFEADDPVDELAALLDEVAPRCLGREGAVVTVAPGQAPGSRVLTYGFTDYGEVVNAVAVELTPLPGGRAAVAIDYRPHFLGRWKRYAEKTRRWALRQAHDCAL